MVQCRFELFLLVVRFVVVLCRQFFYLLVRQNSRQMFFFLENDRPDLLSQKQQIGDNYEREKEQQPTTKGTTRNEKWKLRTECVCFYYNCCCFSFVFIIVYVFFFFCSTVVCFIRNIARVSVVAKVSSFASLQL